MPENSDAYAFCRFAVDRLVFAVPLTDLEVTEEGFMLIRIRHHDKRSR
jgi:hypothetical protein